MKVTQREIEKLPDGLHRVDAGLYVRVRGNSRSFIFKYQLDGKRRELAIGSALRMPLAVAKETALRYRTGLASGNDPAAETKKKARTFADVCKEAVEVTDNVRQWRNAKHRAQWTATIETYALPIIGDRPISEITRDDVIKVLDPIWSTKNPTAVRLRGRLERVFAYATFKGEYTRPNPATYRGNLDMVFPPPSKVHTEEHMTAMTLDEAREVCEAFCRRGAVGNLCTVFGILTALRTQEFVLAQWDEVDFDARIFSVPAGRQKVARGTPHRVPLSDQAFAVLCRLREFDPDMSGPIFKSPRDATKSLVKETPRALLKKFFKRQITMHGTRSTFRVWAEETGQNASAAERALMHEEQNKVTRAYQRSDLLDIRRPLMQEWADAVLPMDVLNSLWK